MIETQPSHARDLSIEQCNALVVSVVQIDGHWHVVSRYGDDRWIFTGVTTNHGPARWTLNFNRVPPVLRSVAKAIFYRYLQRGRAGQKRPVTTSIAQLYFDAVPFFCHLARIKIQSLAGATPMACANYVHEVKSLRTGRKGKFLAVGTMSSRFSAVEAVHELSQFTDDPMLSKPWPDTSAAILAGRRETQHTRKNGTTPLMPDDVFSKLFQAAWGHVCRGDELLDLRDEMEGIADKCTGRARNTIMRAKNRQLVVRGWTGRLKALNRAILDLRTACYVIVASLSGCRNHELAFVQAGASYQTEEEDGEVYWWMRSQSTKTGEGHTEWMIPEAAAKALTLMDRWAKPYQATIEAEIVRRRTADPSDPNIAEAQRHVRAVFLGVDNSMGNMVRTLSLTLWGVALKGFAKSNGIDWQLASHQFRRKFASYAARSQFGDLRYLKEHFKHWAMDMTLGYALNESQEMSLYAEIKDELDDLKDGVVQHWLEPNEPLAGGLGRNVMAWRGAHDVTLFKSQRQMIRSLSDSVAIRSSGHGWCTADDNLCIGNGSLDRTRCTQCNNAVIGRIHAHIYQGLYDQLKTVAMCDDIGEGGLARVHRDIDRCRDVLVSLGYDPEGKVA